MVQLIERALRQAGQGEPAPALLYAHGDYGVFAPLRHAEPGEP